MDGICIGGGVFMYIHDSIKCKRRLDVPSDDLEVIGTEDEPPKRKSFFVLAWYRAPSDPVGSFTKLEEVL